MAGNRVAQEKSALDAPKVSVYSQKVYDLEERSARFGEAIVKFARAMPVDSVTSPLISQLVRAGTSVGANYCEADDSGSKKEFRYRISVCKRECRETKY